MPDDLRSTLYATYLSSFKGEPDLVGDGASVWWDHKYLPLLSDLPRAAPMLEIGCGSGGLLAYLARRGFSHASGIDISREQVAAARQRGVDVELADVFSHLTTVTDAYRAVLAVDVLEHFNREEVLRVATAIWQALEPGGRFIVQTANGAGLLSRQVIYGDLTHQTIFTPGSLGQLLGAVGFERLTFYETGPIPIRVRGKLDVMLWAGIKAVANAVKHVETGKRQAIWTENFICRAFKPA
jgi:SAM-dependent methyltransferase